VERHRLKEVPTFAEFSAERYLSYAQSRKRSWAIDETLLRNHLLPLFGEFRMNRIMRSDVINMHQVIKEQGYAAGTCNRILVLFHFYL
jgi:hypothetical protein